MTNADFNLAPMHSEQEVTKMILMCNSLAEITSLICSNEIQMNNYQKALCNTLVVMDLDYLESKDKLWISAFYIGYFSASVVALTSADDAIKDEKMKSFYRLIRDAHERVRTSGKIGL